MKKIFCYGKKNEKGITLTALVITVVVLSAIAAVGLKAADSEIKSVNEIQNEAQKQEDKLENTGKQINKMYDDLDIKDVDLTAEIKQTTCSFEISNVQLQNSSEIIGRYKYFIKEKDSSSYREISSTKDNFMTMDKLRHNTQYDIKIEVYNQSGKKIKTSVKTAKTNELTAGSLILKLKDNAGAEYTPGTWTASDVYVRQVEGNAGKTTYQTVGSSAQTIAQGTSGETIVSKSGVTTIRVITTDGTNTVNGKDYVIKIDKEAPISGALKMQLDNNNGAEYKNDTWTKHDVYVSLQQGNSNLSGIKSTVYNVTGAESHTNQTQPLTLKTTGTYTINVITTNNVGTTSTKTYTVKIDKDAPEAGKLIMKLGDNKGNDYTDGTWTNQNVYIAKQDGTDALSGHKSTVYNVTGKSNISNTQDAITLTETGEYTLTVITTDNAENTSTRIYKVKIDKVNPTTPEVTNPSNGEWTKGQVKITIKSTDANSGIDRIEWFENGAWTTRQLTTTNGVGTITYTVDRNTVIRFRAVDKAGNISDEVTTTIKLDTSTPDKQAPEATSTPSTIKVTFKQTDHLSGINGSTIRYAIYKDGKWSAWQTSDTFTGLIHNAEYKVKTQVSDNVGNTSESNETTISTKKLEAGTLKLNLINASGNSYVSGQWTKSNVYVSLSQAQYGTSNYESISGSAQTVATGTTADSLITKAGITTLRVKTVDGPNTVYSQNYIVKVDNQNPTAGTLTMKLNSSTGSTYTSGNWTNQNVWIHKNDGSDNLSGHQSTTYNVSGAETLNNQTADNTIQTEGTYTLTVKTLDKVSNSSTRGYTVKIDKTAPTDVAPIATATTNSITATFKQTDSLSGINNSSIQYAIKDGNSWSSWQTSKTFTGLKTNQTYIIKTKATDNAGNTRESKELSITTTELKAGTLTLTKETATGSAYTSGQWSNKNVYVKLVQSSTGTSTYSSTSNSAQLVSAGTTVDTTVSTNGTTTLKVTTTDGTNTSTNSYIIKIDKTAPTVGTLTMKLGSSTGTTYTSGNWTNQNVWVHKNDGSDSQSGHKSTTYTISAASLTNQTADNTLTKEGKYTAVVTTTDNVSNSSTKNYNINIDKTAPTTVAPTAFQTTNSITVTNKQTDALSGVSSTQYAIYNGSSWSSWQSSNVFSGLTTNKTYKVKTKTTDKAGNSSESAELSVTTSNLTAGSLTLKHTNASGAAYTANTWTKDSVYVTLNNGSAGTTTYASISGSAQTVAATSSATTITTSGTTKLVVTTTDVTNTVKSGEYIIKVDKNAPTNTAPTTSVTTNSVTVTCKQTDSLSGINASTTQYAIYKGSSWSAWQTSNKFTGLTHNTSYKVKTKISDNVGNSGESAETTVSTSKLAAGSLTLKHTNASGAAYTLGSWSTTDIYVTLTRASTGTTTYESISGSAQTVATGTTAATTITTAGTTTLRVKTTDGTNTVYSSNYVIKIDKTKPTAGTMTMKLGSSTGSTYTSGIWTNQSVYIALNNGSDETGGSGHSSTTYSISGAATQSNQTAAQTLTAAGKYTITITTKDIAGNSSTRTQYIYIDKTKPTAGTLTMKLDSSTGSSYSNNTWTNHSVYISLNNGSDETNGSGHSSTTYSISGSATQSNQTAAQTLLATGTYNITVTTKDKAGNTSTNNYVIKIDKKAPNVGTLTMKLDSASGENYTNDTWTNHNIYIAVNNGNDANSGHQSTTYSISGPITVTNSSEARTLTAEGTYTVVLTTKDMAGNTATRTYTIKVDKTPPQVQLSNNGGDFNIKSREELLNYSDYNKISSEWTTRITYGSASHNDTDVENSNFYGNFPSVALNLNVSYKNSLSIFSKQKLDVTNIDKIVLKAFLYENGPNNDMINTTRFGLATSDAEADKNWLTYVQKEYKGSPETCENGTVAQTVNYETFEIDTTSIVGEYYVQLNVSHNFLGGYTATTHIETMYYEYNSSTVGNMSSKISCSDNNGISNVRYSWSTSSTQEPANWTNITNNSLVNQKLKKGSYYLWVKATDNVGNEKIFVSSPYNVNYEISYDTNGSSQPPKTQTKIPGKQLTLTEEIPTRRGYTFKCWNTKEDGTGTNYYPGSIYQNDESITLCAIWNRNIVPDLRKPNVTFTQTPSELTSGNVTVNVSISSDLISRGYTLQTSKNYNTGWTDASSQIATENYDRIYARLRDNNGNFGDYVTYIVQNIDKYPPVIQQITVVSNGIKLTVIDPYNGVITGYAITENNAQPSTFIDCYVGTLDTTITNIALTKGKTYYIWVRDRMNFITYKTITI